MATENTSTTLDSLFKEVYASELKDLVPEQLKVQRLAPLSEDGQVGDKYVAPVSLSGEHGISHFSATEDAGTLRAAVASTLGEVQLQPAQYVLRSQIGYNALWKAAKAGKTAFKQATQTVTMNMVKSLKKRVELDMLYGQRPIGTVSGLASQVITITDATWAPGMWAGSKNAVIDVYQSDGSTLRQGDLVVASVSLANKTVTVTGTTTGIVSGDLIYMDTANVAGTLKTMAGLDKIANTSSGTLFNVDATNELWQAQRYNVGGRLTMRHILKASAQAVELGLEEDVVCLIPSKAYADLNANEAAFRDYDGSYKKDEAVNGVKGLRFVGEHGDILISGHNMVKQGESFLLNPKDVKRIYTTDVTFTRPGTGGSGGIFRELTDAAGYEMRAYTAQAFYLERPSQFVQLYGITY